MTHFRVLTPVSRPGFLTQVGRSLAEASLGPFKVTWHIKFDCEEESIVGTSLRNAMLNDIPEDDNSYIWFLDDDTLVHEDMFHEAAQLIRLFPSIKAIVFSQQRPHNQLWAGPYNARVGGIDTGQVLMRRDFIGDKRLLEDNYCADGEFYKDLLVNNEEIDENLFANRVYGEGLIYLNVYYSPKLFSLYNVLRPDAPS